MFEIDGKQAADGDESVNDQTEGGDGAQGNDDDLDTLLQEFDEETSQTGDNAGGKHATGDEDDTGLVGRLETLEGALAQKDLDASIDIMKSADDSLSVFKPGRLRAVIESEAREDPRIARAWLNRHQNPKAWQSICKGIGTKFAGELSGVTDSDATAGRDAARALAKGTPARNTSTDLGGVSEDRLRDMSDAEFDAHEEKMARDAKLQGAA